MVNFLDAELRGTDTDRARIARDGVLGAAVPGVGRHDRLPNPELIDPRGTVSRPATGRQLYELSPGPASRMKTANAPVRGRTPEFSWSCFDRYGLVTVTCRVVVPILPHPSVEVRVTV